MKYNCTIVEIEDDVVTVSIDDIELTGFFNAGITNETFDEINIKIELYGDLKIEVETRHEKELVKCGDSLAYSISGILDIDNSVLHSLLDFKIDPNILYNHGYLDGKFVRVEVQRLDFEVVN